MLLALIGINLAIFFKRWKLIKSFPVSMEPTLSDWRRYPVGCQRDAQPYMISFAWMIRRIPMINWSNG